MRLHLERLIARHSPGVRLTGGYQRRCAFSPWHEQLLGWLQPIERYELVGKDPWAPAMLERVAGALGDEALIGVSRAVQKASAARRAARQAEWPAMLQVLSVSVTTVEERSEPDPMAGEPRRLGPAPDALL